MIKIAVKNKAALLLCVLAVLLTGCQLHIPVGTNDNYTGESYPDAEKYQTGAFTYPANEIKAVEIFWRSGEVKITESDNTELTGRESGEDLPQDTAMHYLLDGDVLKIRFCASGQKINVNVKDKHLSLEIPKGIDISVHTTAAAVKADTLNQKNILVATLSGRTELGTVIAEGVNLSSNSGAIHADSIVAQSLECSASSGDILLDSMISQESMITTGSGNVKLSPADAISAEVHTSSGTVELILAKGGAEILHTTSSGKLLTDRAYNRKGDLYVFDEGLSTVTAETSSGDVKIR